MNYKVITNYTKDILVDFKHFTLTRKSRLKPWMLYVMCLVVIVCSFIYNRRFELNFTTVVYPLIAVVGALMVTLIYYVNPSKGGNPLEGKTVEYIFNDDGVLSGETFLPYNDFTNIYEDKKYFYFYVNDSDGFLVKKEDVDFDLSGILKEKVKSKKKLKLNKTKA